ncbi:hypothetical protein DSAG12_03029 [Promethearchaeum syntrophicum]|uniref:Uncharacterized protein n=1 Tax=Promethearchaeum syntrophicum TaxID=2594042 RepID=A0A5B9DEC9_9ARCH|nr:hypothetical protein [Candidatus Prometheoarchaeum syntrophicum]QEE17197.1 hypothetical protein DSAG12_03029 [Candidatus Prometheoarchaeum syntrophicum]
MNSISLTYLKSIIVSTLIFSAAIGTSYAINPAFVMVPQHNYTHQLYDESGDALDPNIDIIEYGSYLEDDQLILYLIVDGIISETNATYQLFIVAKSAANEGAHVYYVDIDVEAEREYNYGSYVEISGDTISIRNSADNFIPDSYMIGLEARAMNFDERDTTSSARDNVLITKFLGIF